MSWNPQQSWNSNTAQQPPNGGFGAPPQGPSQGSPPNQFGAANNHPQHAATTGWSQSAPPASQWGPTAATTPFPPQNNGGQHAATTGWAQGGAQQPFQGQPPSGPNTAPFQNNNNGQWANAQQFGQTSQFPPQQQQQWNNNAPAPTWPQPAPQQRQQQQQWNAPPPQQQQSQQQSWQVPSGGPTGASAQMWHNNNNTAPQNTNNQGWAPAKTLSRFQQQKLPEQTANAGWTLDAKAQRAAMCAAHLTNKST